MRAVVLAVVVVSLCTAVAFAQTESGSPTGVERFVPRFNSAAPPRAMPHFWSRNNQIGGIAEAAAVVCCVPRNGGRSRAIDCRLAWEAPAGHGFGEAAMRVAGQRRRLTVQSHADYQRLIPGQEFPIVIRFATSSIDNARSLRPSETEQDQLCNTRYASAP